MILTPEEKATIEKINLARRENSKIRDKKLRKPLKIDEAELTDNVQRFVGMSGPDDKRNARALEIEIVKPTKPNPEATNENNL